MRDNKELQARILSLLVISKDVCTATWRIGRLLREKCSDCRNQLIRMEKSGLVSRHRYSTVNNIHWQLVKKDSQK